MAVESLRRRAVSGGFEKLAQAKMAEQSAIARKKKRGRKKALASGP